jgi:hypothetical protein
MNIRRASVQRVVEGSREDFLVSRNACVSLIYSIYQCFVLMLTLS